jgi:hypothetical protein
MAETALLREIEAALKRIETGLAQASAGIASLQGPLSVMANLLLVTREGRPAVGDQELPEAEETVPDDPVPLRSKGIFSGDSQAQVPKFEKPPRARREPEPPAAEEVGPGGEDQPPSGVVLDNAAKERISKIEERLRSLED